MPLTDAGWRRLVPNLATLLTLVLGLGAIEAARFGDPELSLRFILLAILSDGVDGVLARRWGVSSSFGGHLDALSDLVAFGVAPGILFAAQHPEAPGPVRVVTMAMIALAGAWRLARFQSEPAQTDFSGLPITVGGPLFGLAIAGFVPAGSVGAIGWAVALAALMASRVPYPRFTAGKLGRIAWPLAVLFLLGLAMDGKAALIAAEIGLAAYVVWGLVRSLNQGAIGDRAATDRRGRGE